MTHWASTLHIGRRRERPPRRGCAKLCAIYKYRRRKNNSTQPHNRNVAIGVVGRQLDLEIIATASSMRCGSGRNSGHVVASARSNFGALDRPHLFVVDIGRIAALSQRHRHRVPVADATASIGHKCHRRRQQARLHRQQSAGRRLAIDQRTGALTFPPPTTHHSLL